MEGITITTQVVHKGGARANMAVMEGDQSTETQNHGSATEREVKKGGQQGETSFG